MTDTMRGSVDTNGCKHVVLGLIFLKYISDAFEEDHTKQKKSSVAEPEELNGHRLQNIPWAPSGAR
jgi:type I restriction enzyme M protein